jgi:hypothetical protein
MSSQLLHASITRVWDTGKARWPRIVRIQSEGAHRMIRKTLLLMVAAVSAAALTITIQSRHEIARYRAITKM